MYEGKNLRRGSVWPYHALFVAMSTILAGLLLVPSHKHETPGFILTIGWLLFCVTVFFVTAKALDTITTSVKECCKGEVLDRLTGSIERGEPIAPVMDQVDRETRLFQEYVKKRPIYHRLLATSTVGVAIGLGIVVSMSL
jgi:hypothetical protein